jgi:hypothetical protein
MRIALLFWIFGCVSHTAFSQTSINAAGSTIKNQSGSISYSVGQFDYQIGSTINQGVQQPREFFIIGVNNFAKSKNTLHLFPNPTSGILNIRLSSPELCRYILYDEKGKKLHSTSSHSSTVQIEINHLPRGVYLLKILRSNGQTKNYSVIHL